MGDWVADLTAVSNVNDKRVCLNCVQDIYLKKQICAKMTSGVCSYCTTADRCVTFSQFSEFVGRGLAQKYRSATTDEDSVYNGAFDLYEQTRAVLEVFEHVVTNEELLGDLVAVFGESSRWTSDEIAGLPVEDGSDWAYLEWIVKHSRHYTFLDAPLPVEAEMQGLPTPRQVVERIHQAVIDYRLFRDFPAGQRWYRAREFDPNCNISWCAKELGTPPSGLGASGRMNPPGVSVFYGSDTARGAAAETVRSVHNHMMIGEFQQLRALRLLDLTQIPDVASVFDSADEHSEDLTRTLQAFRQGVSAPYKQADPAYYVPSQMIAEYLRFAEDGAGRTMDGIVWTSTVDSRALVCALFLTGYETDCDAPYDQERIDAERLLLGYETGAELPDKALMLVDRVEYFSAIKAIL